MPSLLAIAILLVLFAGPVNAMQAGVPMASIEVPAKMMVANCVTTVTPMTPADLLEKSAVVVRVVVSKTGSVYPINVVSGPSALQAEAMNTVRLWRYIPYSRGGEVLNVNTEVQVDFIPRAPGGMVSHPKHLPNMQ
jgi:protein TonB